MDLARRDQCGRPAAVGVRQNAVEAERWVPRAREDAAPDRRSGRRADVAGLDRKGRLVFAEVKSCQADFDADNKWTDYLDFCDAFYFAVARDFPLDLLPSAEGLILADAYGGAVVRESQERPLVAARRKSITLRFARQAAARAAFNVEDMPE